MRQDFLDALLLSTTNLHLGSRLSAPTSSPQTIIQPQCRSQYVLSLSLHQLSPPTAIGSARSLSRLNNSHRSSSTLTPSPAQRRRKNRLDPYRHPARSAGQHALGSDSLQEAQRRRAAPGAAALGAADKGRLCALPLGAQQQRRRRRHGEAAVGVPGQALRRQPPAQGH